MERIKVSDIELIIEKIDNVDEFSMYIVNYTGSSHENKNELGISHFLEHMLFKGTKNRNSIEIVKELEEIGASINAATNKNMTYYKVRSLTSNQEKTFDILFDMYTNSIFPIEEFNKEKKVILEEVNMYDDDPISRLYKYSNNTAINGSYKHEIIGGYKEVESIEYENLVKYYKERYTKENTKIFISGNFSMDVLEKKIDEYFKELKNESKKIIKEKFSFNEGLYKFNEENLQVNILITYNLGKLTNEDRINLIGFSKLFAEGMSSKLFVKMREELALCYSVYAYTENYDDNILYRIYIGTNKKNYENAIKHIDILIKELIEENITESNLNFIHNNLISKSIFSKYNTDRRNINNISSLNTYKELLSMEDIVEKFKNISGEKILEIANKILISPKNITITGKFDE